ncbi:MAG TPA: MFS transporter [Noviherbaspirillum sp.]
MDDKKASLVARAKIVFPLAIMQIIVWGTIYISFPLIVEPIHRELNWSRNAINGAMSLALLSCALAQLALGHIIERLGACRTIAVGAVGTAAAMAAASFSYSAPSFYCAWGAVGISMALCFFEPVFALLMERMPEEFEDNVNALLLISGATSAIFVPLTHALIEGVGWRMTLRCFCVFNAATALLAVGLMCTPRCTSQAKPIRRTPSGAGKPVAIWRDALGTLRFWTLSLAFAANLFALTALVTQLPAILASRDFPVKLTLVTLGIIGPAQAAGRLVQLGPFRMLPYAGMAIAAFALFSVAAIVLHLFTSSSTAALLSIAAIGLGSGIITSIRATIVAILFDRSHYVHLNGAIAAPASLARAAAPCAASIIATSIAGTEGVLYLVSAAALMALWMMIWTLHEYRNARNRK